MSATGATSLVTPAVLLLTACVAAAQGPTLTDPDGRPVAPLDGAAARPCCSSPPPNARSPTATRREVRRLAARFAPAGVRFWLVYANAGETPAAIREHAAAFGYGLPVALDAEARLADRAQAAVTPEAAVFDATGAARLSRPHR